MMVVAAGNSGPGCSTVSDPPAIYAASYTIGALTTGTDTLPASAAAARSLRWKQPHQAGYFRSGQGTRSCSNSSDSAYTTASGTSMATPHVFGAMALLVVGAPKFATPDTASRDALNSQPFYRFDPVRHRGPTKQRVWMGPGRYLCRCERRITHANAYSYCDSNGYRHCNGNSHSDSNSNSNGNGNSYSYSNGDSDSHS